MVYLRICCNMDNRDNLIILYDYYGELLSEDNRKYFEDYYFDNLSLGEIAENNSISRNAIHKHIKNAIEKLEFYEEKLKLFEKDKKLNTLIDDIKDEKIKNIVNNLLKDL